MPEEVEHIKPEQLQATLTSLRKRQYPESSSARIASFWFADIKKTPKYAYEKGEPYKVFAIADGPENNRGRVLMRELQPYDITSFQNREQVNAILSLPTLLDHRDIETRPGFDLKSVLDIIPMLRQLENNEGVDTVNLLSQAYAGKQEQMREGFVIFDRKNKRQLLAIPTKYYGRLLLVETELGAQNLAVACKKLAEPRKTHWRTISEEAVKREIKIGLLSVFPSEFEISEIPHPVQTLQRIPA